MLVRIVHSWIIVHTDRDTKGNLVAGVYVPDIQQHLWRLTIRLDYLVLRLSKLSITLNAMMMGGQ